MKKAIVIFVIALTILALLSFNHSFIVDYGYSRVSGTSAVIFAKADDVSVRTSFSVVAVIGANATLTFSNGTQVNIVPWASTKFTTFLPKTGSSLNHQSVSGVYLNEEKPFKIAFMSNTTDTTFDSLNANHSGTTVYWFKIEGEAWVSASSFGVAV